MKIPSRPVLYGALSAAALILGTMVGEAYAGTATTNCRHAYIGGVTCSTVTTPDPVYEPPRSLSESEKALERQAEAMDQAARAQRITRWEEFCHPTPVDGAYGVTRMVYAHKDCDVGRSQ